MSKIKPKVKCFFDKETNTASYIVIDEATRKCAIFDSVLDFDYFSGEISFKNAEKLILFITNNELELQWLIETHIHADHLSAAPYIKNKLGWDDNKNKTSNYIIKITSSSNIFI